MKNFSGLIFGILLSMMISLSGCLDMNVHTLIAPDGSCERVITMKLPSRRLPDNAFPVPIDSTWTVDWKDIAEKDMKYEYTARKMFQTPEDFQHEYAALSDTNAIGINASIDREFEWFFTYIEYNEEYSFRNPFGNIPVSDYLSKEEVERFVGGDKNDSLKRKVDRWMSRDLFEELYRPLVAEAKRHTETPDLASLLQEKTELCFDRFLEIDSVNSKNPKHAEDPRNDNVDNAEGTLRAIAKVLHSDAVLALRPAAENAWRILETKLNRMKHPDAWRYSVQMPGLILSSNSPTVEGNTATWKFGADQIQVGTYRMHAASRVSNVWAFVVTGIVSILVVLIAIRNTFRHRSSMRRFT